MKFLFRGIGLLFVFFVLSCAKDGVKQLNLNRVKGIRGPLAPVVDGNRVTFRIKAKEAVLVTITGSFNGWNSEANPMEKGEDGIWKITLPLKEGQSYRYLFVVDGFFVADPDNPDVESDGFGGVHSKITVSRGKK